jgi:hypothetical protein
LLIPVAGASVAAIVWLLTWRRCSLQLRLGLAIYCGAYFVTTALGATIIALPGGIDLWMAYNGGANAAIVENIGSLSYWFLLYAPFFIPMWLALLLERRLPTPGRSFPRLPSIPISFAGFCTVFIACSLYLYAMLARYGYLNPSGLQAFEGDYVGLILYREEIFSRMGRTFFGLLYMGIPTLAVIALAKAVKSREAVWRTAFLACSAVVISCILLTAQKAPIVVYVLTVAAGFVVLKGVRFWSITVALVGGFSMINAFQIFPLGDWSALQSIFLVVFRMANSFPFYLSLFPSTVPYTGIDLGLDVIGLAPRPNENEIVFTYMYPQVTWAQGAAPAPAHVSAYAQAGLWFAVATLCVIGIFLAVLAKIGKNIENPYRFAIYVQGLVLLYYLTQITLRGVLITNYGAVWVIAILILVALSTTTARYLGASVSTQINTSQNTNRGNV